MTNTEQSRQTGWLREDHPDYGKPCAYETWDGPCGKPAVYRAPFTGNMAWGVFCEEHGARVEQDNDYVHNGVDQ
jgi:hypothetical protein